MSRPAWVAWAVCAAIACSCARREETPAERGAGIFLRSCSGCHGADGRGVPRVGLATPPRDLGDAAWQATITDDAMRTSIAGGKGQMPAFGALLEPSSIDDLVAFVRSLPKGR